MKNGSKLFTVAVLFWLFWFILTLCAQPIVLDPEPVVDVEMKKLDPQTLEVKTTTTTVQTVEHDKQELVTELAHIPDFIAKHQAHINTLNGRAIELENMLKVLE